MDDSCRIVALGELPEDESVLFAVADGEERVEAVLLRLADDVVAYENYCQHWTAEIY